MRRGFPIPLLAALLLVAPLATASAQPRPRHAASAPARGGPPHEWLFGVWTGGLFPVLDGMVARDCTTQPTVGFAQDTVAHTTLLADGMVRRVIETVRATPNGAEFRFSPAETDSAGFGCDDPNTLNVERVNLDTITFPHCSAFPYPLKRCPRQ